jgi:hypothetical protein
VASPAKPRPYECREEITAAFGLWLRGKTPDKVRYRPEIGDVRINAGLFHHPHIVYVSEIPGLFTEDFYRVLAAWWRYHIGMGLPFSGGWAEQPAHVVAYIETFESYYQAYQQEQQWQSQKSLESKYRQK